MEVFQFSTRQTGPEKKHDLPKITHQTVTILEIEPGS